MRANQYQRALGARAAFFCEHALDQRCRCRCGGQLHGANRDVLRLRRFDPHYPARLYCPGLLHFEQEGSTCACPCACHRHFGVSKVPETLNSSIALIITSAKRSGANIGDVELRGLLGQLRRTNEFKRQPSEVTDWDLGVVVTNLFNILKVFGLTNKQLATIRDGLISQFKELTQFDRSDQPNANSSHDPRGGVSHSRPLRHRGG